MKTPDLGTVLQSDDGLAVVVTPDADPLDALIELLDADFLGPFSRDNPVVMGAAERLKVEVWRYCTKAWCAADGRDGDDFLGGWWAPHGDGKRSIHVVYVVRNLWALGEQAKVAELAMAAG